MYLSHYNIEIMPFEWNADSTFTWLGEKHKEALAVLKFGFQENKGFVLLTGDIGSGKTTLINCFLNENDTASIITSIPDPDLSIEDFFRLLTHDFGFNIDFKTKGEFLLKFKDFLEQTYSDQKKVLLIIDEAQRLNQQLLEQIRLLSNIEKRDGKLFSIFLVGQNDLHKYLVNNQNKALRQRVAVHCHVETLTEAETRDYIDYRLRVAGSEKEIFSHEAISGIFSFSKGCPRLINTICDRALLTGYAQDISQLDHKVIQKCADELTLPGEKEYTLEKSATEEINENHRKAFEEMPIPEVRNENNRETPDAKPEAEAVRDTNRDTAEQKSETDASKCKPITRGPGAKHKPSKISVNEQELFSQDKSTLKTRAITVAVAILMITLVALYLWLGT